MADCVTELITQSIENAIHGKAIVINGENKTLTCERERFVNVVAGRYPFVLLSGPILQVESRAHRVCNCNIHYQLSLSDNSVSDEYSEDTVVTPITKVYGNAVADLVKMVMTSHNRDGHAQMTEITNSGYYFDNDGDTPIFCLLLEINVIALINNLDPYLTGG